MPGPGRKKGKKSPTKKASNLPDEIPPACVRAIQDTTGWNPVIKLLWDHFDLPDLLTHAELEKVQVNFDTIYKRLDGAYRRHLGNEKIVGGIIGIYTRMCADPMLRRKLCEEGLLTKAVGLLDVRSCRFLALRALATSTYNGGAHASAMIAKHCSSFVRFMNRNPDDTMAELIVTIASHSFRALAEQPTAVQSTAMKSLDLDPLVIACLNAIKRPGSSRYLVGHAAELFAIIAQHLSSKCQALVLNTNFLIAALNSKYWAFRGGCLTALIKLHELNAESDQVQLDPMKFIAAVQRGFPDELQDIMMNYGLMQTEAYMTLKTTEDYQQAMLTVVQDKDLYSLGIRLAEFILRTEFSIGEGVFRAEDPVTGKTKNANFGLPFTRWPDALPHCARAVRRKGKTSEADAADILDIKYHIMRQRISEAVRAAKDALRRNPDCAYFYYAITLSGDSAEGLHAAKKGLKCDQSTPFVRFRMMQRAVEHAGQMGLRLLQDGFAHDMKKLDEGVAFLASALEDSEIYLEQAPPDSRHMKNVLYWNILLTLIMKDSNIESLLQRAADKLRIADNFSRCFGIKPPRTSMRLAVDCIMKDFISASAEYSGSIGVMVPGDSCMAELRRDQAIVGWFERMAFCDVDEPAAGHCSPPSVDATQAGMYRCSWCGNPSTALQKSNGDSLTGYCDEECQKAHWKEHGEACRPALSTS